MSASRLQLVTAVTAFLLIGTLGGVQGASAQGPGRGSPDGRLAWGLLRILGEKPENVVVSPHANTLLLRLAALGARGDTARELDALLGPEPENVELPAPAGPNRVGKDEKVRLWLATAVWLQKGIRLSGSFRETAVRRYGAAVAQVNFVEDPEAAVHAINAWVAQATADKIRELMTGDTIEPRTRLVLTSATYFKALWASPFEPSDTKDRKFLLPGESAVMVKMMAAVSRYGYAQDAVSSYLRMPFVDRRYALVLALPREPQPPLTVGPGLLAAAERRGDGPKFEERLVNLWLPRFKIRRRTDLRAPLRALGVRDAFDPDRADFGGLVDTPMKLAVSAVAHEAFLSVDEQGCEAAAASAMNFEITSAQGAQRVPDFHADHPFLFAIVDEKSHSILFLGQVVNPVGKDSAR
jgi:serpin B